jgi:sugar lactone lactonase YvrE
MKRLSLAAVTAALLVATALPAAGSAYPPVIDLPTAFQPEGIAIGPGHTFYAGSLADGSILAGDLRTGEVGELVAGAEGRVAVGMSYDARSGYLFVAGGLNGVGRVYDAATGGLLREYPMMSGGPSGDFINDVIVTRSAAYYTNSFAPVIYRVPLGKAGSLPESSDVAAIPLSGEWVQIPGFFAFNANGIEATPSGDTLIIVNSSGQALYAVDPATGAAALIDLGGDDVPNGDGLVLSGNTLYVVQNRSNQVGRISLGRDLTTGAVGEPIVSPDFAVPTTAARFGDSLYVVNAKFGSPPDVTDYEIVEIRLR